MEISPTNPAPPSLAGVIWRSITRDDLAVIVELAEISCLAAGGIAFLNEPANLERRYFQGGSGIAIGAFAVGGILVA